MKLFVTGGTGFIGSHFLRVALQAGHEVLALRRPGSLPRIPLLTEPHWLEKSWDQLGAADFQEVDVVVHFSAQGVSPQKVTWAEAMRHNVADQMGCLERAGEAGVRRFILCGSCVEYGERAALLDRIPPDHPLEGQGPYAVSKAVGCIASLAWARSTHALLAYLRVFHAYGEGQHESNLWPSLRRAARAGEDFPMTPGEQVRDFVPVEHVAAEFLRAAVEWDLKPGQPVVRNVGTGRPQTVLEFARQWWNRWGAKGRLLPGAVPYRDHEIMRLVPKLDEG